MTDSPIREHGDVDRLYEALAFASAEFQPIIKNKTADAGKYTYRYADLADVLDAVRPALSKFGLITTQPTSIQGDRLIVVSRLAHRSGAWIESDYPVAGIGGGIAHQTVGGALSYARRYGLSSLLSIAAEDDVDSGEGKADQVTGNAPWPSQPPRQAPPKAAEPPRRAPPATQADPQSNVRPTPSTGGEAVNSAGSTTHTTAETTTQKKPSVIDKDDPIIVDLRGHLETWDQLRTWHNANKTKIMERPEDWRNEFYGRFDDHAIRLKKEAGLAN